MAFHDAYMVKPGDNLTTIARAHGYANPGPIWAYRPNQALFRGRSPNLLRPGEQLLVPYQPDLLKKIIATSRHLIHEIGQDAAALIREQDANQGQLEAFLFKIDAANFLAGLGVSIGSLVARGAKGTQMSSREALRWLVGDHLPGRAGNVASLVIPAPEAPRRDFKFYVRHALGPWNPSFWASVAAAIREGDVDLYLYGADATTYNAKRRIKDQAEADIARLRQRLQEAEAQLNDPCYRARI